MNQESLNIFKKKSLSAKDQYKPGYLKASGLCVCVNSEHTGKATFQYGQFATIYFWEEPGPPVRKVYGVFHLPTRYPYQLAYSLMSY